MAQKSPYDVVKRQHVTEKTVILQQLKNAESSKTLKRCAAPKYVFIVDPSANKVEIANAVEEIYREKNVKVTSVNTINVKARPRRVRGFRGRKSGFKKAIVTLAENDSLDEV